MHTSAPQLYGLPKIHKNNVPLRPIVSTIGSPCYLLAKELARILSPLAGKTETFVKNSTDFVQRTKDLTINDNDMMVSFDVTSLFTRVPIDEALLIVKDLLQEDRELDDRTPLSPTAVCELTKLCLRGTYFHQNGNYWEQADGAAMGSPLSPIIANLYMEHFEQEAIRLAVDKPKFWIRYVDDTFVIWPHGRDSLTLFHEHINRLRDPIKFTMEIEDEGRIPFLDVLVQRSRNQLTTSVFRKKTHTDRYLNFRSYHHPRIKTGIISCLKNRAHNICSDKALQPEIEHLNTAFQSNGYPSRVIQRVLTREKKSSKEHSQEEGEKPKTLYIPFVKGFSEKVEKRLRHLNIRTVHRTKTTIRNRLVRVKGREDPNNVSGVIYSIPCECGAAYIEETGRTLKIRISEHQRAVKNQNSNNDIAVHVMKTHHNIQWAEARVIAKEPYLMKRRVKGRRVSSSGEQRET